MTEMAPVSNVGRFTSAAPGASGRIVPNMQMKIVDVDGNVIQLTGPFRVRDREILSHFDERAQRDTRNASPFTYSVLSSISRRIPVFHWFGCRK